MTSHQFWNLRTRLPSSSLWAHNQFELLLHKPISFSFSLSLSRIVISLSLPNRVELQRKRRIYKLGLLSTFLVVFGGDMELVEPTQFRWGTMWRRATNRCTPVWWAYCISPIKGSRGSGSMRKDRVRWITCGSRTISTSPIGTDRGIILLLITCCWFRPVRALLDTQIILFGWWLFCLIDYLIYNLVYWVFGRIEDEIELAYVLGGMLRRLVRDWNLPLYIQDIALFFVGDFCSLLGSHSSICCKGFCPLPISGKKILGLGKSCIA